MEREYKIVYVVDDAGAIGKLNNIHNVLNQVNAAALQANATMNAGSTGLQNFGVTGVNAFRNVSAAVSTLSTQVANVSANVQVMKGHTESLIPTWQVFEMGLMVAMKFGEEINKARDYLDKLAEKAMETRDHFRELANLQGHEGPDDEIIAQNAILGIKGGLNIDETVKFMEQFEGSFPAARDKGNVDPALKQELAIEGMRFGNRVNLKPQTSGDLTAVLGQYRKINSVEDAANDLGKISHGLNEGRGNLEPLVRSLLKAAGTTVEEQGGAVSSLPELAAIIGVASMNANPDKAGMHVVQAVRGLRHFQGKQGEALGKMGITPQMRFREALEKIEPFIKAADKSGEGADVALRRIGFGQEEEIRGIVQLARNMEVVRARLKTADAAGEGAKVVEADANFQKKDKAGLTRGIHAEQRVREHLAGQKRELLKMAREAGANFHKEEGWAGGTVNRARVLAANFMGGHWVGARRDQLQLEQEESFVENLRKEGSKLGIDLDEEHSKVNEPELRERQKKNLGYVPKANRREINFDKDENFVKDMIVTIMAKGGQPFGDSKDVLRRLESLVEEGKKTNELLRQGNVPPAGPGAGAARPVRK